MRRLLLFLLFASQAFAFPNLLNLDGYLTNSSGSALNGSFSFVFSLYNVSSGGSALWSESQTLTVSSGKLNALLGSVASLTLPFDQDYYLGVSISPDSEMSPRFRIASGAYSYTSKSLVPGANASGNLYVSGNVGIGTTGPNARLDVRQSADTSLGGIIVKNVATGDNLRLWADSSGKGRISAGNADAITIDQSNGNVGIGTTSPADLLHIVGSGDAGLRINGTTRTRINLMGTSPGWQIEAPGSAGNSPSGTFSIVEVGIANRFTIQNGTGNVGIGTGGPTAPLTVYRYFSADGLIAVYNYSTYYNRNMLFGIKSNVPYIQVTAADGTGTANMALNPNGGYIGIGTTTPTTALQVIGTITGTTKSFSIQHPLDPGKLLVHSTLEGPEIAVFYRGEAQLQGGIAKVTLPSYFEALTRKENRTVQLTNIDGFDPLAVKTSNGHAIQDGSFTVYSSDPASSQRFFWEVKAVRSDVPPLEVEQNK